jgi:outer membrane lipoprotein carrier protein LolA
MKTSLFRRWSAALVLASCTATAAAAMTASELQRLLQAAPLKPVAFTETRESPWLAQPVETRGTLVAKPGSLEKRINSPREEVWRLLEDRVEYVAAGETVRKQILFSQSKAVAVLSDTLRRIVMGDLATLERDFHMDVTGDARSWTVRLSAANADIARVIEHAEIEGAGGELRTIVIVDRQGERTTTRIER